MTIRHRLFSSLLTLPLPLLAQDTAPADRFFELDPQVVTGTRTVHRLSESPVRTEVVLPHQLQLAGACNFGDAIELLPGVRVENNCQNCGTSDVLLLGLEGKYAAVLFDGLPLYSGLASVYGLDQIPAVFIDRIEVVKGGGSAVYGSGAVGGVVNIIGHRAVDTGGLIELRYDSVKGEPGTQVSALGDYLSDDGRLAFSAYGQALRQDPVDLNGDGFSDLTKRDLQVFGFRASQELGQGTLQLDYNRTSEFRRGGNKFDLPDNLADISERVDTSRDAGTIAWQATVDSDLSYHAAAGFSYIDRETFYGGLFGNAANAPLVPESTPGAGDNDQLFLDRGYQTYGQVAQDQFGFTQNWVYHAEAQVDYGWGEHLTSLGLQYSYEKIDDIVPVSTFVVDYPVAPEIADGNTVGVFVQDDWHFSEGWELVLGLRADKSSELDQAILSPRVNLRWEASNEWVFRAAFGTGYRAPEFFDEDLHIELIAGERAQTRQAEDLKEERSYSGLLSAVWNPAIAAGRLTVEANAFYTALDGTFTTSEIQTDPSSGEAFRLRYNGPDAEVGGLEFNVGALPLENLRVDLGYVFQFARYKDDVVLFDDGAGHVVTEDDFLETPTHYGVIQLTYTNPAAVDVAVSAIYTGSMKQINERTGILNDETDRFLVWNASLSRTFNWQGYPALTLTAGVKNLFDERQGDLETGVDRDPYYLYGPRTPRTWYISGRLNF
ncbi:MAG: TonB-dependent receptor [Verrucomicrobiota bacterium JB022]|nr:TonB-dependent receptor [Verrucomicrobiota bacterium JB022]